MDIVFLPPVATGLKRKVVSVDGGIGDGAISNEVVDVECEVIKNKFNDISELAMLWKVVS